MIKRRLVVLVFTALSAISTLAKADFMSGNDLHSGLQTTNAVDKAYALGYVIGIADFEDYKNKTQGNSKRSSCFFVPDTASGTQVTDVVKNWLDKHPGRRHYAASSVVAAALRETFPCK